MPWDTLGGHTKNIPKTGLGNRSKCVQNTQPSSIFEGRVGSQSAIALGSGGPSPYKGGTHLRYSPLTLKIIAQDFFLEPLGDSWDTLGGHVKQRTQKRQKTDFPRGRNVSKLYNCLHFLHVAKARGWIQTRTCGGAVGGLPTLGIPPFPSKITSWGTLLAPLDQPWRPCQIYTQKKPRELFSKRPKCVRTV